MSNIDAIARAVSAWYDVDVDEVLGERRTAHVTRVRHVAIWLARRTTERSLREIAEVFGRDPTSIWPAIENVWKRAAEDEAFAGELAALMERLRSDAPPPEAAAAAVAEIDAAIEALQRARVELISAHAPPLQGTPEKRIDRDMELIRAAARERGRQARRERPRRLPAEDSRT